MYEAVNSLLNSTIRTQIIFIDDTPTQSAKIRDLTGTENQLWKILKTGGGQGYGEALRIGSLEVDSRLMALFNSDDLISPQKFEIQLEKLGKSEISLTGIQRINKNGKELRSMTFLPRGLFYDPIFLFLGSYGADATWLMKTDWWREHVLFDSRECLDWRIALKNFHGARISYVPEKLYFYRKHPHQVTAKKDIGAEKMLPVYQEWKNFAQIRGLPECSYETFAALSTPWNSKSKINIAEFEFFCRDLIKIAGTLPQGIRDDVENIIRRRYLMLLKNQKLDLKVLSILYRGRRQAIPMWQDLTSNFINNHVLN